ncbi:MAG: sugar transferase, partial [Verrucomicrobiota bacterium]
DNQELRDRAIYGVPVRGSTESIAKNVPVAILAMTKIDSDRMSSLMEGALASYLKVMIIPNLIHAPSLWATSRDLSGTPSLEMSNNLIDPSKRILKRSFELGLTVAALPFWGPVYGLICGLIWLEDKESPIYKQKRIGQGATEFETWKFRTMVPNAETVLQEKLAEDPALKEEWETHFKLREDPRITKVGKVLRKTSLDEIPQLVNVLRGQMSLIGPRPLPSYHYAELPPSVRRLRERVKPGMTGLWQVSGRSDAGNEGMVRWDPYYVRNWSLWLDIVILVRTFRVVLAGSGAR